MFSSNVPRCFGVRFIPLLYNIVPFSMEIDRLIAAILIVVGYSINDTVVVLIELESTQSFKRGDQNEVVNKALNSTLSRTLNTSLSTFLVLLIIFILEESIRGFRSH